jgi:biotin carboxylase
MSQRVLLLLPTTSYKARDFLAAAEQLNVDVTVGTERRQALDSVAPGRSLVLDFTRPEASLARIVEAARGAPFRAVLGVDDETTVLAAAAGAALGLPHNPVAAARASRDKYESRKSISAAGLRAPAFRRVGLDEIPEEAARGVAFPCVLKPLGLSASRGVLRADNREEFADAFRTIAAILQRPEIKLKGGDTAHLLVEDYIPGVEVAVEGLLDRGRLHVLALFDKPDPLEGPTFEETIYVTPSRLPEPIRAGIAKEVTAGCAALGLREGPVHAELRLHERQPWLLEIAARTIGGLCSRVLRFGTGITLEELILRHALGL